MEPVYRPVIAFAISLFRTLNWKIAVHGADNIPETGPAVLACNHVGYLDFVFVGFAARKRGKRLVRFMAKKEVFDHKISGPLMRGMKHIPVDRFGARTQAIDAAVEKMREGELVGMFPEGTISRSFVPRAGKTGAARMAMDAGAPLIPCAVWGTQRILTKGRPKNFQRNVAISIYIGEPVPYSTGEDLATVTDRLMFAISDLVKRAEKEYPQQPADEGDRWWLPAHLGGSAPTPEQADAIAEREKRERAAKRSAELQEPPA